jgi:hypothetical protein
LRLHSGFAGISGLKSQVIEKQMKIKF